jgi:hypothetical protein
MDKKEGLMRSKLLIVGLLAMLGGLLVSSLVVSPAGAGGGYEVVTKVVSVPMGTQKIASVKCPIGMKPTGGGAHYGSGAFAGANSDYAYVADSDVSGKGWKATLVVTPAQSDSSFTISVICTS